MWKGKQWDEVIGINESRDCAPNLEEAVPDHTKAVIPSASGSFLTSTSRRRPSNDEQRRARASPRRVHTFAT